ncbi:BgTH12-01590 [Blumeria graminis f. sp. triticale]|uniref:BgTH12-01588 n=1 Tax=Blumeria graminis f. sp. triticale TaxID=1689686 RepID=A0A9W4GE23_BLUGR|nr:BgTH12-01588 [Blumeria graminis f. sp. triticale]CAD6501338.1 BgTH12-01590 [Blumeria graminis f. sp. triticale]
MFDHRALLILFFSFTLSLASPVPAWGEYKLNTQYPPWPSRPCADFGASACFHAEGREDLLVSRGMSVSRWCVTQVRRCGYRVRAVQAMAKQVDAESADGNDERGQH